MLRGRLLWCFAQSTECLSEEDDLLIKNRVVDLSLKSLKGQKILSIKLIATRALVKYLRKTNTESLIENADKFEPILDDLLQLLDSTHKEVMHLPIEAFQTLSRVNRDSVSKMAPKITPKLLSVFKLEHSQSNLGHELLSLFK